MKGHGFTVDWWTFGILVYEMATGRPPFMHKNHHQLGMLIRNSPIIFPDPVRHKIFMSDELKDLISKVIFLPLIFFSCLIEIHIKDLVLKMTLMKSLTIHSLEMLIFRSFKDKK